VSIKTTSSILLLLLFALALLFVCCGQAKQHATQPVGSAITGTGRIKIQSGVNAGQLSNKKPICCVAAPSRFKKTVLHAESSALKRDSSNH
jgi:hypothetical protein